MKRFLLPSILFLVFSIGAQAQFRDFPAGSIIIDMGQTPQTINNGLKPYGLIFDLMQDNVPVSWIINPSKAKDGVDFTHDGVDYKGGPYVINGDFVTPTVAATCATWATNWPGLTYVTTTSEITNVYEFKRMTAVPLWAINLENSAITTGYLDDASIPTANFNIVNPNNLDECDDIFMMAHSDPSFASHNNIYNYLKPVDQGGLGGWLWAGCHAVSVLENLEGTITQYAFGENTSTNWTGVSNIFDAPDGAYTSTSDAGNNVLLIDGPDQPAGKTITIHARNNSGTSGTLSLRSRTVAFGYSATTNITIPANTSTVTTFAYVIPTNGIDELELVSDNLNIEIDAVSVDITTRFNFLADDLAYYKSETVDGITYNDEHFPYNAAVGSGSTKNNSINTANEPHEYDYPTHPFMQYMGLSDGAHAGGSEQIYTPDLHDDGSNYNVKTQWRPTTKISMWDPQHSDLAGGSPTQQEAPAIMAFGPAYGIPTWGTVFYEGGHEFNNGSDAENVAAIRAYLNFSFLAASEKATPTGVVSIPSIMTSATAQSISIAATNPPNGTGIAGYSWSSSCGGTFSSTTVSNPTFTPPTVTEATSCIITAVILDNCGREIAFPTKVTIVPPPAPPVAENDFVAVYDYDVPVTINVLDNDSDPNLDALTADLDPNGNATQVGTTYTTADGDWEDNGDGTVTFTPSAAFLSTVSTSGTATAVLEYRAADPGPLYSSIVTISVLVKENPCSTGDIVISTTTENPTTAATTAAVTEIYGSGTKNDFGTNPGDAIDGDNTTYAYATSGADKLEYDKFGSNAIGVTVFPTSVDIYFNNTTGSNLTGIELKADGSSDVIATISIAPGASIYNMDLTSIIGTGITKYKIDKMPVGGGVSRIDLNYSTDQFDNVTNAQGSSDGSYATAAISNASMEFSGFTYQSGLTSVSTGTEVSFYINSPSTPMSFDVTPQLVGANGATTTVNTSGTGVETVTYIATSAFDKLLITTASSGLQIDAIEYGFPVCGTAPCTANSLGITTSEDLNTSQNISTWFTPSGTNNIDFSTLSLTTAATHGTVTLNTTTGLITYDPDAGYIGDDSFEVDICDDASPTACCQTISISVTIKPSPTILGDINTAYMNYDIVGNALTNDFDETGSALEIVKVGNIPMVPAGITRTTPQGGSLTINPDGSYSYTPDDFFTGIDTVRYKACNAEGACKSSFIVFVVNKISANNSDINAIYDVVLTYANEAVDISVLENDIDFDGPVTYAGLTSMSTTLTPNSGGTAIESSGVYTYTPPTGFTGLDYFKYEICDNGTPQSCDETYVFVAVLPERVGGSLSALDPVFAQDDMYSTAGITPITGDILNNDFELDGKTLKVLNFNSGGAPAKAPSVTTITTAAGSTLEINDDGQFTYTPFPGFVGTENFVYLVGNGQQDEENFATLYIEVGPRANVIVKAWLEGPFLPAQGKMSTLLNDATQTGTNVLKVHATSQPFNTLPWNYAGTEAVHSAEFFDVHPEVVDWVLVELRDATDPTIVVAQRAGFLTDEGTIIDAKHGIEGLHFTAVNDNYIIAVHHRNHGSLYSATAKSFNRWNGGPVVWDTRSSTADIAGIQNVKTIVSGANTYYVMYAGDNEKVSGGNDMNANDEAYWLGENGKVPVYNKADHDLNQDVNANDEALWLANNGIVLYVPTP